MSYKMTFKEYHDKYATGKGWEIFYIVQLVLSSIVILANAFLVPDSAWIQIIHLLCTVAALVLFVLFKDWRVPVAELVVTVISAFIKDSYGIEFNVGGIFILNSIYIAYRLYKLNKNYINYLNAPTVTNTESAPKINQPVNSVSRETVQAQPYMAVSSFAYYFALRYSCAGNFPVLADKPEDELMSLIAKTFYSKLDDKKMQEILDQVNSSTVGRQDYNIYASGTRMALFVANTWIRFNPALNEYEQVYAVCNQMNEILNKLDDGKTDYTPSSRGFHSKAIADFLNPTHAQRNNVIEAPAGSSDNKIFVQAERFIAIMDFSAAQVSLDNIDHSQRTAKWYYLCGKCYEGLSDPQKANECFYLAQTMDPQNVEYRYRVTDIVNPPNAK